MLHPENRQPSTGGVAVTATGATTPLSVRTMKNKNKRFKMEAHMGMSQQRRYVGHACGKMRRDGTRFGAENDVIIDFLKMMRQPTAPSVEKLGGMEPRDLDPHGA